MYASMIAADVKITTKKGANSKYVKLMLGERTSGGGHEGESGERREEMGVEGEQWPTLVEVAARDLPAGGSPRTGTAGECEGGRSRYHHHAPPAKARGLSGGLGWSAEMTNAVGGRGGGGCQVVVREKERGSSGSRGGDAGVAVSLHAICLGSRVGDTSERQSRGGKRGTIDEGRGVRW